MGVMVANSGDYQVTKLARPSLLIVMRQLMIHACEESCPLLDRSRNPTRSLRRRSDLLKPSTADSVISFRMTWRVNRDHDLSIQAWKRWIDMPSDLVPKQNKRWCSQI